MKKEKNIKMIMQRLLKMKQVILVRNDLKLPKGKMAAQCSHAAVEAAFNSDKKKVAEWRKEGAKKIILKVKDEKEMIKYLQKAKDAGLKTALITDAGMTVVAPGTKTCVGIGPAPSNMIDKITGNIPLYRGTK